MSKAVLVRGAFAIQCNSPALPVWLTVTACSHPCSHCHSSMEMTGTVHRSDLAKWRLDDIRCRRTIRRWKAWLVSFRSMCGAGGVEQKIFIHPVNSSKQTVGPTPLQNESDFRSRFVVLGGDETRNDGEQCGVRK